MVMKKISLNELFSELDMSSEELPKLHYSDEVSYKNVQQRVLSKIEAVEITASNSNKANPARRLLLGIGIAAALIAGGVGTYSISNAGKNAVFEETRATIDSGPMEIKTNSGDFQNKLNGYDWIPNFSDFSSYIDVYEYDVKNTIDALKVEEVKYYCARNQTWILVHFKSDLPDGISILDTEFGNCYGDQTTFGRGIISHVVMTSESSDDDLYVAFGYQNNGIDPMENEYLINRQNLFRKDTEKITDLGMKNLMGFTNAEIAAGKKYTDKMKSRIENEFTMIDNYYYHNEDVLCIGEISILVDISPRKLDINKSIIPASMEIYQNPIKWPSVSDSIDEIKAEVVGVNTSGTLSNVLVKFTPENGYILDENFMFKKEKAALYVIDPETGNKKYLSDDVIKFDSYTDFTGDTNNGVPCIYNKFEWMTGQSNDVYCELICEKAVNTDTNSIISNGDIRMDIYLGNIGREDKISSDSFTTDDGFDIDIEFGFNEIRMKWQYKDGKKIPKFLKNCRIVDDKIVSSDFNIVMKNGLIYPVRMNILIDDDNYASAAGLFISPINFIDKIERIEFDGVTIYTAE